MPRFLSTPSARRATSRLPAELVCCAYFYPRPPRGGRRGKSWTRLPLRYFYPRPPRGGRPKHHAEGRTNLGNFYPRPPRGGRHDTSGSCGWSVRFLSTPSARRATHAVRNPGERISISIHALREEGDPQRATRYRVASYFYPRPPRGGRLQCERPGKADKKFLSTPSARRATTAGEAMPLHLQISIHALREEGDALTDAYATGFTHFYPRPPRGGRLRLSSFSLLPSVFLSTPSARRATPRR